MTSSHSSRSMSRWMKVASKMTIASGDACAVSVSMAVSVPISWSRAAYALLPPGPSGMSTRSVRDSKS